MKNKFAKWCVKRGALATLVCSLTAMFIYSLLMVLLDASIGTILILDVVIAVISVIYVSGQKDVSLADACNKMNESCDPAVLLNEVDFQKKYVKSGRHLQLLELNYCVAINNLGEHRRAAEISKEINIDKYSGTLPNCKAIYYNNQANYLMECGEIGEADIWFKKAKDICADIKNRKQRDILEKSFKLTEADMEYARGNCDRAAEILAYVKPSCRIQSVSIAFTWAQIHISKGEVALAKEKLSFVISNGNKLACVSKAIEMLRSFEG